MIANPCDQGSGQRLAWVIVVAAMTMTVLSCRGPDRPALPDETWMDGTFAQVRVAGWYVCGLRTEGEVSCRDTALVDDDGHTTDRRLAGTPRRQRYSTISGGMFTDQATDDNAGLDTEYFCGVRADDREIDCWGAPASRVSGTPPVGAFSTVSVGVNIACGIRDSETLVCWGPRSGEVPAGTFTTLDGLSNQPDHGFAAPCGIRTDGQVWCTGSDSHPPHQPPATVDTRAKALGGDCVVEEPTNHVECWTDGADSPPPVPFVAISGPGAHGAACGILDTANLLCWGVGNSQSPEGTYTAVHVGRSGTACAIHTDGHLECWNP